MSTLRLDAGRMNSLWSFNRSVAPGLKEFTENYQRGVLPEVIWDLNHVVTGHQSIAALCSFLAVGVHLSRFLRSRFSESAPTATLSWNPMVLSFWKDIGLLDLIQEYEVLEWPFELGGYDFGKMNPNSKVLLFDMPKLSRSAFSSEDELHFAKRKNRESVEDEVVARCDQLFSSTTAGKAVSPKLRQDLAIYVGELVTNSHIWGENFAVIGLQITRARATVVVVDVGIGLRASLNKKYAMGEAPWSQTSLEASVTASFLNPRELGLMRIIDEVTAHRGTVEISTGGAFLRWDSNLWAQCRALAREGLAACDLVPRLITQAHATDAATGRSIGFIREWEPGVRGTRIVFDIPLSEVP